MMLLSRSATAAVATCRAAQRVCQLHTACKHRVLAHRGSLQLPSCPSVSSSTRSFRISTTTAASPRMVVAAAGETNTVELEVKVEGMKCGGCSSKVEATLKAMDHVKGVQVDLETKLATVEVEAPNLIDAMNMLPLFVKAIKEIGFEAEPHIEYQA